MEDIPPTCARGETFMVDQSMICKLGGFITQRHKELRDLVAEFLSVVCSDVEIEQVLQDISGDQLNRGSHHRFGAPTWSPQATKTCGVHFFYKSLFFSLEN